MQTISETHHSPIANRISKGLSIAWWIMLLRGIAAIAFGVLCWVRPDISLATLTLVFGVYALVDGALGSWVAITSRKTNDDWWILLLWALVSLGAGVLTFMHPDATALALLFYIAVWAIAAGVLQLVVAFLLRKEIEGEWRLVVIGLASIIFGVLLMARPNEGALAVLWIIGTYALTVGALTAALAFRVRKLRNLVKTP